jgi:hypothetical protein
MLVRMQQNRSPYTLLKGTQIITTIMEIIMNILQKAKGGTSISSFVTTTDHISKGT